MVAEPSLVPLASFAVFDGLDAIALTDLSAQLRVERIEAGDSVFRQGELALSFAVVLDGQATVVADDDVGRHTVGHVGPGDLIGEVGLLTGRPRAATVTAVSPLVLARGDEHAFASLLAYRGVEDRLVDLMRDRLARDVRPVMVNSTTGHRLALRPVLASDRDALMAAARDASEETLRRRFLTGGLPTSRMIDYLVCVNYVDHFAWVALDPQSGDSPIGIGRYVRLRGDPTTAEVAFTVQDSQQGHGVGTTLLGAVSAVAPLAGIERFVASLRSDNVAMRAVLAKAGATFSMEEPGVTHAELDPRQAASLLDPIDRQALAAAAFAVVTATG